MCLPNFVVCLDVGVYHFLDFMSRKPLSNKLDGASSIMVIVTSNLQLCTEAAKESHWQLLDLNIVDRHKQWL
jgi:hypothetical protein